MTTRQDLIDSLQHTFIACLETCRKKNSDYAHTDEAWGNLVLAERLFPGHISKEMAVVIRMGDKLQRLANGCTRELQVKDESFIDTCDDMIVYAGILKAMWQEKTVVKMGAPLRNLLRSRNQEIVKPGEGPLRIYIAGPFTGDGSEIDKLTNMENAAYIQQQLTLMGHFPHCPHTHTYELDGIFAGYDDIDEHDYFMKLDLRYIEQMMDALIRLPGDSPGADKEVKLAKAIGLPVFHCISDVPLPYPPQEDPNDRNDRNPNRGCVDGAEEAAGQAHQLHRNESTVLQSQKV